jgi:hypothetical protein
MINCAVFSCVGVCGLVKFEILRDANLNKKPETINYVLSLRYRRWRYPLNKVPARAASEKKTTK